MQESIKAALDSERQQNAELAGKVEAAVTAAAAAATAVVEPTEQVELSRLDRNQISDAHRPCGCGHEIQNSESGYVL